MCGTARGSIQVSTGKQHANPERCTSVPAMGYTLVNHNDPSVETFRDVFYKMRRSLGTTAFGINEVRLPADLEGIEHDERETGHEEVYIVLEGSGTMTVDGEAVSLGSGDYLRVDAESTRLVAAGPDGLTYVVVAGKPLPEYDGRSSL